MAIDNYLWHVPKLFEFQLYIFNDTFTNYSELIKEDKVCFFVGKDFNDNESENLTRMIVNKIYEMENIRYNIVKNINISFDYTNTDKTLLDELETLQQKYRGNYSMILHLNTNVDIPQKIISDQLRFSIDDKTLKELRKIFGFKNVWLSI